MSVTFTSAQASGTLQERVGNMLGAVLGHLPDTIEYWADLDATPSAPTANRDPFGLSCTTSAPAPAPVTGLRKIDQCSGQLTPSMQKQGRVVAGSTQDVPVAPWIITVPTNKVREWGLSKDDELRTQGRRFKIVAPGGADSFSPLRLFYCEEQA